MNAIRQTQLLNKRELENATPPSASWHADYRDTAWIYIGGLHLDLTEGDVCIIFSQYGTPTHLNLIRDRENGKSKGFGFLKYEDQRSCDLAVDNLGGGEVLGRLLRVDHTRYKKRDDEDEETYRIEKLEAAQEAEERAMNGNGKRGTDTEDDSDGSGRSKKKRRHLLKEEHELEDMLAIKEAGEDEDPMRDYLIREKKEEVEKAKRREDQKGESRRHRHHHRKDRDGDNEKEPESRDRAHRQRHRNEHQNDHERRKNIDDTENKRERRDDRDDDGRRQGHRTREMHRDRVEGHPQRHRREDSRERLSSRDRNRVWDRPSRGRVDA